MKKSISKDKISNTTRNSSKKEFFLYPKKSLQNKLPKNMFSQVNIHENDHELTDYNKRRQLERDQNKCNR